MLTVQKNTRKILEKQLWVIYDAFTTHSLRCTVSYWRNMVGPWM